MQLLIVSVLLLAPLVSLAQEPKAAPEISDPILLKLVEKGVFTAAEARTVSDRDRLLELLLRKGVFSADDVRELAPASAAAQPSRPIQPDRDDSSRYRPPSRREAARRSGGCGRRHALTRAPGRSGEAGRNRARYQTGKRRQFEGLRLCEGEPHLRQFLTFRHRHAAALYERRHGSDGGSRIPRPGPQYAPWQSVRMA